MGTEGFIDGTVKAKTVVVSGRVKGSISADRLEIIAGGKVEGDVHIIELVIEPGGRFNGSSEILASEQPSARKSAAKAADSGGRGKQTGAQPDPDSSTAPS